MSVEARLWAQQGAFLFQMFAFPEKNGFYCIRLLKKLPKK